jgi:hypothetical protein
MPEVPRPHEAPFERGKMAPKMTIHRTSAKTPWSSPPRMARSCCASRWTTPTCSAWVSAKPLANQPEGPICRVCRWPVEH